MSNEVISLTSSDEEEKAEPPSKRIKPTPVLPECTLTVVKGKKKRKEYKEIDTVTLDSDEEVLGNREGPFTLPNNIQRKIEKTGEDGVKNGKTSEEKVDLISLTDDEDDVHQNIEQVNGILHSIFNAEPTNGIAELSNSFVKANHDTVSIEDSDTDEEGNKNEIEKEKSDNSIIINDSDEDMEKENHCENGYSDSFVVNIEKTSIKDVLPSTSKDEVSKAKAIFKKFLKMVEEKIVDSSFEEILPKKVPIIQKYFNRSGSNVNNKSFESLVTECTENIKKSTSSNGANNAVLAFHKVFEHLKQQVSETTIEIEEDDIIKVKKLEKTMRLLRKRIRQLEDAEVNFDDDEDSAYIQLDKYQSRLNKVYTKYCKYIKRNPYGGRATYDRINFVNSSYNEVNLALTKKYKNSVEFPSYYELEKYITKVLKKQKIKLSEQEIEVESKKCFKVLGGILQKKRRQELYDSHLAFIEFSEDPASKDNSLENVLRKNYIDGVEKIEKLCAKFAAKQESGEDKVSSCPESSEESEEENVMLKT